MGTLAGSAPRVQSAMNGDDAAVLALWHEWRRTGDPRLHERLVLTFAPLVKYIAYRTKADIPSHHQVEEFISAGLEALVGALERFDPDRGVKLSRFLWPRIHGAMVDEMRAGEWVPRSVRRTAREIRTAHASLTQALGRRPSTDELCETLGMTAEQLARWRAAADQITVESLDVPVAVENTSLRRIDTVVSADAEGNPCLQSERSDAHERLHAAISKLPERDQKILVLGHVYRLTLAQVGELIGVSESRVSQLSTVALARLRALLEGDRELLLELTV